MKGRLHLDVVIRGSTTVFELFASTQKLAKKEKKKRNELTTTRVCEGTTVFELVASDSR